MKRDLLNILVCPQCLGKLQQNNLGDKDVIEGGALFCPQCHLFFPVHHQVPFFGMREAHADGLLGEMHGELCEFLNLYDIKHHRDFARASFPLVERAVAMLEAVVGPRRELLLLDAGAGLCNHSYQLACHGFSVVAAELVPEYVLAADILSQGTSYFERVVTDCSLLPFEDNTFDIVFVKELIHHLFEPDVFLSEICRVGKEDGCVLIIEPCFPWYIKPIAEKNDATLKHIGIHHRYYSAGEYRKMLRGHMRILAQDGSDLVRNTKKHPFLHSFQNLATRILPQPLWPAVRIFKSLMLGGSYLALGSKRRIKVAFATDRQLMPISPAACHSHGHEIEFLRDVVHPALMAIYRNRHDSTG